VPPGIRLLVQVSAPSLLCYYPLELVLSTIFRPHRGRAERETASEQSEAVSVSPAEEGSACRVKS
jgi:hypothetical protein